MKDRRKNKTKRKVLLALYLAVCLVIIVAAYFHEQGSADFNGDIWS